MGVTGGSPARRPGAGALAAGAALLALVGCAAAPNQTAAADAAERFLASAAADPATACALLAPGTLETVEEEGRPCPAVLAGEGFARASAPAVVVVAGHSAQVRFGEQAVFLALFDDGWKVIAAGCRRTASDPAVPWDCAVEA